MSGILGGDLECEYSKHSAKLRPEHHYCKIESVDLSAALSSEAHSFSGSSDEKSQATTVWLKGTDLFASSIDFIPKEILTEFPNVNGLNIGGFNSPIIKDNIFTEDFKVIEYLDLAVNEIKTIKPNAFEHLIKLKWIDLTHNEFFSLRYQIFAKNPELIYIDFNWNVITSIIPNFFNGLNQLKMVDFESNECVDELFGCETCLVSHADLKANLTECFSNCHSYKPCAAQLAKIATTA